MFSKRRVNVYITAESLENSVEPDQMPHPVASIQYLHFLLGSVCPNT